MISATHSPLVLASVESVFDPAQDAWFDFDYDPTGKPNQVVVTRRVFEPQGDVSNWLTSEAFDLPGARDPIFQVLIQEAASLIDHPEPSKESVQAMYKRLLKALNPRDPFLFRWRAICTKKRLLP